MLISQEELSRIEKEIESELIPYIESTKALVVGSKEDELLNRAYMDFRVRFHPAWEKFDLLTKEFPTECEETTFKDQVYEMFAYLVLVETLGNNVVNMIIMLLAACGRGFEIKKKSLFGFRRAVFAGSIEQIEGARIPLRVRLNFLKHNGISRLSSLINTRVRNEIAHLNFEIKGNEIRIEGKLEYDIVAPCYLKLYRALKHSDILIMRMATSRWVKPAQ